MSGKSMCNPCRRERTCEEAGCGAKSEARDLCRRHYRQAVDERRFGNPECTEDDCSRGATGSGVCRVHDVARRRAAGYKDPGRLGRPNSGGVRRRAKRWNLRPEQVESIRKCKVFERDNWVCGICGDPTDRSAKWPHPDAAVLDHVVPLSDPDTPGHLWSNVQCAHHRCNAEKGGVRIDTCQNVGASSTAQ